MSDTDLTGRIWAGVPELTAQARALRVVEQRLKQVSDVAFAQSEIPSRLDRIGRLIAGETLPEELGRELEDEAATGDRLQREANWCAQAATDLRGMIANTRVIYADTALIALDCELHEIVAAVRGLEPILEKVHTADDAVRGGTEVTTAWQQLTALVSRYQQVRSQQAVVVGDARGDRHAAVGMIDRAGRYANTEDFNPIRSLIADYVDAEPSEPKTTNQPGHLRWLARSEVLSWVPTIEALADADALRQKAIADAEVARATSKG